jgi:predicted ribosome quality control (RQC) complex YloA/Tae2 family protein
MAFDGVFLAGICHELQTDILGGKVDKIHQPDAATIILSIRHQGTNRQLLISAHPVFSRIHTIAEKRDNPSYPPLFCMVLRKHLSGGKIISIHQPGLERLCEIKFSCINELGDPEEKSLICEIMGKHSNVLLVNKNREIIDGIKRIGRHLSSYREVLPGRPYVTPPAQDKLELTKVTEEQIAKVIMNTGEQVKLSKLLINTFQGISPLLANELVYRSGLDLSATAEFCGQREIQLIFLALKKLADMLLTGSYTPSLAYQKKDPTAFSCITLTHLPGAIIQPTATVNQTADRFYRAKENTARFNQVRDNLFQKISSEIDKLQAKLAVQQSTLAAAQSSEEDKIKGQLLTANLHQIKPGQEAVTVPNYHSAEMATVTIILNPLLSPAENAQMYFKRYNKSKKAIEFLTKHLGLGQEEMAYLESVLITISQAGDLTDLEELKQELIQGKYLPQPRREEKKKAAVRPAPLDFVSTDGITMLVGKNNRQNDWLTFKQSNEQDIWLHAKNIPGAHVLIKAGGQTVPETTIYQGALLAAYFSKSRYSSQVPVDYTLIKHVKKPGGAKPGMVTYTNQKTIYTRAADPWLNSLGLEE